MARDCFPIRAVQRLGAIGAATTEIQHRKLGATCRIVIAASAAATAMSEGQDDMIAGLDRLDRGPDRLNHARSLMTQ